MKTVLFIALPLPSHYYPTFRLAHYLKEMGFRVVYSGTPDCRKIVEAEGFCFKPLTYMYGFLVQRFKVALGLFLLNLSDRTFLRKRYKEHLKAVGAVKELIGTERPSIVFLDDMLSHYQLYLCPLVKVVHLNPKFLVNRYKGIPPLSSYWLPKNRFIDRVVANAQWLWFIQRHKFRSSSLDRILFLGRGNEYFRRRYASKSGVKMLDALDENNADTKKNIVWASLAPLSLEFPHRRLRSNEFCLHFEYARKEEFVFSDAYREVLEGCLQKKKAKKCRLVYVSLGTLASNKNNRAPRFLKKIEKALGGLESVQVIVSTGSNGQVDPDPRITNIHWLPVVPQLHLLTHCDLVITHGGFNTIIECIEREVPMLAYPLNEKADHPGNAARMVAHGLGLRGRMKDSPHSIRRKALAVLNDETYRAKCREMRESFQKEEGKKSLHRILDGINLYRNRKTAVLTGLN